MILFRCAEDAMGYKYYYYNKGDIKTATFADIVSLQQYHPEIKVTSYNSESFTFKSKSGVMIHSDMIPTVDINGNLLNNSVSIVGVEKLGNVILRVKVEPWFDVGAWSRMERIPEGNVNRWCDLHSGFWLDYVTLQKYVNTRGLRVYNGIFENGVFVPMFVPLFSNEPNEIDVTQVNETLLNPYTFHIDNDNHVIISGIKPWYQLKELKIPPYVSWLSDYCFAKMGIEKVQVNGLLHISNYCFSGCTNLKKAVFHIADIKGTGAFSGCPNLQEVSIHRAVSIGDCAFENCVGLRKVDIDKDLLYRFTLGARAFAGCRDMTLDLHQSYLVNCGDAPFNGAENISIIADKSVLDSYGNKLMQGCKNIKLYYWEKICERFPVVHEPNKKQLVLYKSNG